MKRLFLTLFEEYLLHEDRRAYPCWIGVQCRFRGKLDREELEAALELTVRRNPLLACVVRRQWDGRLYWQPVPGWRPVPDWREAAADTEGTAWAHPDLFREPGFRVVVAAGGAEGPEVLVQMHHAVLDGLGAFMVINEILIHYARAKGRAVELPEVSPELFEQRNRFGLTWGDKLRMAPAQVVGLLASWQLECRRPVALAEHRRRPDDEEAPAEWPAVASRPFSEKEHGEIREAAKRLGAGTNDLFIRDLFAAIGAWRRAQGEGGGAGGKTEWVRLGVPVSLRGAGDRKLGAANVIGVVSLDRSAGSLGNRARLLRRAREDMAWIKEKGLDHTFGVLLWLARRWRGGIRGLTGRRVCANTMMLTNLGQLFSRSALRGADKKLAVPGAVLEAVTMIAPYRPGSCATLSVGTYAGRLLADLHYDPRFLTRTEADGLLGAFAEQLRLSVEERAVE